MKRATRSALAAIVRLGLRPPEVGMKLKQGDSFGTIESVKAVSELYAPVSGEVVEVNLALKEKPEDVNAKPHESWMIVVKPSNAGELDQLLTSQQYEEFVAQGAH